jgi:CRISPR-associated protein Cmr1
MGTRKTPPEQSVLDSAKAALDAAKDDSQWQRYRCKLVTPMYGGGVDAGKVDEKMPIRATAIRGQLRYWWRIAHRQQFIREGKLDSQAMFLRERELWGGLGDAETLAASKVVIKLSGSVANAVFAPAAKYVKKSDGSFKTMPDWEPWAEGYSLFPAQGKASRAGVETPPPKLLKPGAEWDMSINLPVLQDDDHRETETALLWWATFGGIGARTRRGLGAVEVSAVSADGVITSLPSITPQQAKDIGVTLVFRGKSDAAASSALVAWKEAVKAMRLFRQGEGIGRNPGQEQNPPGRSRWPEPDAIRRHANTHAALHAPTHPAEQRFPRAAFGLPIIFHFKDKGKGDPQDSTLSPEGLDRMASPIILRPYKQEDGRWRAVALRLPYGHVAQMDLSLTVKGVRNPLLLQRGGWWPLASDEAGRKAASDAVRPIRFAGTATEPLTAFSRSSRKLNLLRETPNHDNPPPRTFLRSGTKFHRFGAAQP